MKMKKYLQIVTSATETTLTIRMFRAATLSWFRPDETTVQTQLNGEFFRTLILRADC